MTIEIKKASSFTVDEGIKVFLYGDSGAGKTAASCTAPDPLFILTEKNGLNTVRQFAPDAGIIEAPTYQQVREVMIQAGEGGFPQYRTLVFDSLTEIQRQMKDDIAEKGKSPIFTKQDWGTLTEKMRQFLRALRNLQQNVVATALAGHESDDNGRITFPSFQGQKLPNEVAGYFSVVGYCFKRPKETDDKEKAKQNEMEHLVLLNGPSRIICKPCAPLNTIEHPNLTDWFNRIAG